MDGVQEAGQWKESLRKRRELEGQESVCWVSTSGWIPLHS